MLKRRASSPPPSSSSSVPIISDSTSLENIRDSKRRRVLPPVLDGQMRGWGTAQDNLYQAFDEEDDGEEDIIDGDDNPDASSHNKNLDSPYKSANGFLHELHTLQRHRILFSNPHPTQFPYDSSSNQHHPSGKGPAPSPTLVPLSQREALSPLASNTQKQQELNSVKGHYEEMNRLAFRAFWSTKFFIP
ncbi:hypothetical protein BT96DRAFT_239680 [Gymnopus androsaceus JB14]|uniref:Uncharacterized protein n=1 Tax=Gymnopus androsaceus JB14 TaxID=1447944 RepID=A0A6A4IQT2_9AGAR|nr:hypothetical protein BT96DRAFT_239680 [Gymnopus androsaceus JB14]